MSGFPELDALRNIADQFIQSNPSIPDSWNVDLKPCLPIAKAHFKSWSIDKQERDDRRSRGKMFSSVFVSNKGISPTVFVMDSKADTFIIRHRRKESHVLNRATSAIENSCANLLLSRTSAPYYGNEPDAYPFEAENHKELSSVAKDIWVYHRATAGSTNISTKSHYMILRRYHSIPVRVDLFVRAGFADPVAAKQVIKRVYPRGMLVPGAQNPSFETGLGNSLHGMDDQQAKLLVAAVACRGSFDARWTWNRFNSMLVQGGWPWLLQYPRAYARIVYTVMILIFTTIAQYNIQDRAMMKTRLLALAGKLVGDRTSTSSQWKVRKSPYLKGAKVTIPTAIEARTIGPEAEIEGNTPAQEQKSATKAIAWTCKLEDPAPVPNPLPTHIILAESCKHKAVESTPYSGRVKTANSLDEVVLATNDRQSLTVALTWGSERARQEVYAWAIRDRLMTVMKGENQCLACAIRLGHCLAALVVIA